MEWLPHLYVLVFSYFSEQAKDFNPREWGDWFHLFYVPIAILWIAYQFNRFRGRGAKAFDNWVEVQANNLRKNHQQERKEFLDRIHRMRLFPSGEERDCKLRNFIKARYLGRIQSFCC